MHRNSSSERLCCFLRVHKMSAYKNAVLSAWNLELTWAGNVIFLWTLFSLLRSAKQWFLLQWYTCLPSVVINTMKSVFQRFILLFFHYLFLILSLQNMFMKSDCTKLSRLLYFKQFSSSMSTPMVRYFTCHWAFLTKYTCTESTMCSNLFLLLLWAETYLKRKGTCFLKRVVTAVDTVPV